MDRAEIVMISINEHHIYKYVLYIIAIRPIEAVIIQLDEIR